MLSQGQSLSLGFDVIARTASCLQTPVLDWRLAKQLMIWKHVMIWLCHLQRLGVDTDGMLLCQPDSGEMALEVADQLVRSQSVDIIAVDSVAALVPRSEIEGEIGNLQREPIP